MYRKLFSLLISCMLIIGLLTGTALAQSQNSPGNQSSKAEFQNPNYDMILYSELKGWLDDLCKKTNRVTYEIIGKSAGGRDLYQVVVSEPSALGKLGKYKALRNTMMKDPAKAQEMIAKDPDYKVPIFINNSIHGGETTGVDASVKLIEELALQDTDEVQKILKNTIIIFNLDSNPDGRANGWRQNDNGFDCNRDMATQSQPETRAILDIITEWKPMVTIDNHGYVKPILIEPCSMPHNPNYEEDIYQKWALDVAKAAESKLKEEMPEEYPYAEIPYRDYEKEGGWDDYPAIFIPMYAQYYSLTGHTIEVGYRTYDGVLGHYWSNKAMLLFAAENRQAMYKDQLEVLKRGTNYGGPDGNEFPKAYIIPSEKPLQPNPQEAADMVNYLIRAGIEVNAASQSFVVDGKSYPKGTYIVPMNQPLAGLANTLLWKGQDISVDPGLPMYDVSAWNFPELWGFTRVIADKELNVKAAPVNNASIPSPSIANIGSDYYTLACDTNNAVKAVNSLLTNNIKVMQTQRKENNMPAGTFIIEAKGNEANTLKDLSKKYGIGFTGIPSLPSDVKTLRKVKIAALTRYGGSHLTAKGSGTSKLYYVGPLVFVLKDLGFDVDVLWPSDVDQKDLAGYDAVVGLENVSADTFEGNGWSKLTDFFANGGKYIGYGSGGAKFSNSLGLLTTADNYTNSDNNGIVHVNYNTNDPITGCYPQNGTGFIYSPVYFSGFDQNSVEVLASYSKNDLFMAGYWTPEGRTGFAGSPAVIKNDKAVLFGIDPIFRAHIKDSFRLVANSIYDLTSK